MGFSSLTGTKVKPPNNSTVRDHLLYCNYMTLFDNDSILVHENKKYLLEIKERFSIMREINHHRIETLVSQLYTYLIKSPNKF